LGKWEKDLKCKYNPQKKGKKKEKKRKNEVEGVIICLI